MDRQKDYFRGSVDDRIKSLEEAIAGLRRDLAAPGEAPGDRRDTKDNGRIYRGNPAETPEDIAALRKEFAVRRRVRSEDFRLLKPGSSRASVGWEVEALRAEIEVLEARLQEQAAEAEALRRSEVRQIKTLAEGREDALRRSHAAQLTETRKAAGRRLFKLQAQRRADVETLNRKGAEELSRARAALRDRLADLEERAAGLKLRLEAEAGSYAERLRELESQRDRERLAAEEQNLRLQKEHAEVRRRLEDRIADLEGAVEEHEALRRSLLEELELVRTRNEGREVRDAEARSRAQ